MEKELIEKLQLIAHEYGKAALDSAYSNGHGMCLDEKAQIIKFSQALDQNRGREIASKIITAMNEYGYIAKIISDGKCTPIVYEYIIKYSK